ncbi:ricin-type beta-trefoil lectin domain protein [Streptomyces sp. NPDC052727]|uniref:ricin-type beta-trefoil lectin domain protein n=1 Tax=unclassified Streptomyces TaxID=2593676 RepID=UPI00341638E6
MTGTERNGALMRKTRIAAGLGAAAAVMVMATPAHASTWDPDIHSIKNTATGKCLSGSGRTVTQVDCGLPVSGGVRSTDWTFSGDPAGYPRLYRNIATGLCLDTNGTSVYLSGCNADDPGQWWWWLGNDYYIAMRNNMDAVLTGWNTGGVSITYWSQEDASRKNNWRIN